MMKTWRLIHCLWLLPLWAAAADAPLTSRESLPEWARIGRVRATRWDAGPIEAEKGRLSGWPHYTLADERGVMAATRDFYNPRTVEFLKIAHLNWAWVTWSVGLSHQTEKPQWEIVGRYIQECHRKGIRVAAYISIANMFWRDMFQNAPASRSWVELLPNGSPRFYSSSPHRYMARITNPAWLEYVRVRVRAALEAGADAFWIDNTFGYHGAENVERFLAMIHEEARRTGRKIVILSNYNRALYTWARFQNGVTTEDGQEPGYYPEDPEGKRLVTNAGLLRYHVGISEGWRPIAAEYGGRHRGDRFLNPMEPRKWQLAIAECAAFQTSLEPFFEGLFLTDLYRGDSAAMEKLRAIGAYNAFLERNEQYLTEPESPARLAALADATDRIVPLLNRLAERNLQFDVLFNYQEPALERLKQYKVILLPPIQPVSDRLRSNLEEFARAGGTLMKIADAAQSGEITKLLKGTELVEVEAPPNVLYNAVLQRKHSRIVLHLVNYAETPLKNIAVRVKARAGKVRILTPLGRPVTAAITAGRFIVPELDIYSVAVIPYTGYFQGAR